MATAVLPVTPERIQDDFNKRGFYFRFNQHKVATLRMDEYPVTLDLSNPLMLVVSRALYDLPLKGRQSAKLDRVIGEINQRSSFSTLFRVKADKGATIVAQHSFIIRDGLSDEQLDEVLSAGLHATLQHLRHLREEFPTSD